MRFEKLNLIEQRSFKGRNWLGIKNSNLKFGNLGIAVLKCCRFEYVYFNIIKKYLKLLLKLKYSTFKVVKIWVFLKANYPISRKSKNSRMGKGVGSFVRWAIKLKRGFIVVEFFNINRLRVGKILNVWKKHLGFPICLVDR